MRNGMIKGEMRMKNLKKVTALILIAVLTVTLASSAFAGSLIDTFINAGKTAWNGACTVCHTIVDTGEYLFTDATAEHAYAETVKAAKDTANTAVDTGKSTLQIGKDAKDVVEGTVKICEGTVDLIRNGNAKSAWNYITGDGKVDPETWKAMEKMVDGYDQMDNGLILDCVKLVPGVGGVVAGGIEGTKALAEHATGHITDEEFEKECRNAVIDMATGAVGGAAGTAVKETAAKVGVKIVTTAANAGLKELAE